MPARLAALGGKPSDAEARWGHARGRIAALSAPAGKGTLARADFSEGGGGGRKSIGAIDRKNGHFGSCDSRERRNCPSPWSLEPPSTEKLG